MMYNPQLETFLCVAEEGSFNKAAEKLYISAPAVIKQMNSLEKNLGLQLFDRTHRGLKMTAAGESMYQDARYLIQYCKESVARAEKAMESQGEVLRGCIDDAQACRKRTDRAGGSSWRESDADAQRME